MVYKMTQSLCDYCSCVNPFSEAQLQLITASTDEKLGKLKTTSVAGNKLSEESFQCIKKVVELMLSSLTHEGCGYIINNEIGKTYCIGYIERGELKLWQIEKKPFAKGTYSIVSLACSILDPWSPSLAYKECQQMNKGLKLTDIEKSLSDLLQEYIFTHELDDEELKEKIRPAPLMLFNGNYSYEDKIYLKLGHLSPRYETLYDRVLSGPPLDCSQILKICGDLIAMISTFHKKGIAFCDLKLENIFCDGERIYAGDVGSFHREGDPNSSALTPQFTLCDDHNRLFTVCKKLSLEEIPSEENLRLKALYECEHDIAALAMTIFGICTEKHAFKDGADNKFCLLPTTFDKQRGLLEKRGYGAIVPLFIQMVSYDETAATGKGRIDIFTVQEIFNSLNFGGNAAVTAKSSSHLSV
jgi:serine/threonine protein kinase